jgi:hypothetical protein
MVLGAGSGGKKLVDWTVAVCQDLVAVAPRGGERALRLRSPWLVNLSMVCQHVGAQKEVFLSLLSGLVFADSDFTIVKTG